MTMPDTEIQIMSFFVLALKDHYQARELPRTEKGHRQFINPWSQTGGDPGYIFILATSGKVRFGRSVSRSNPMSSRMIEAIATRRLTQSGSLIPSVLANREPPLQSGPELRP